MCGIAGLVDIREQVDAEAVLSALRHRGPDGSGATTAPSGKSTLFHTRLAIVDPLERSAQPMYSVDRRYCLTYNGEVYNHRELRHSLGHNIDWRTESDTETVLHAYMKWGADCVRHMRGMFAFAIWDDLERRLYIARDPLGIKPLLYGCPTTGGLVFASEVRVLTAMRALPAKLDLVAAAEMLRQGAIRQPRTLIQDVRMCPAGHFGVFERGRLELTRYWDPIRFVSGKSSDVPSYPESLELIRSAVEDAAKAHAMADVPIGAFLSGGIDSRLVVGLMQRLSTRPIKTFTIGFGSGDERADARATAKELGTDHAEQVICETAWPDLLEHFLSSIDQPSIDGFNTLAVSQLASPHVKVTLSGLGADELFGGYPHFAMFDAVRARQYHFHAPAALVTRLVRRLGPRRGLSRIGAIARSYQRPDRFLSTMRNGLDSESISRLMRVPRSTLECICAEVATAGTKALLADTDPVNQMSLYEIETYLRDTLLRDVDVFSMRSGLEVRPVLLDTRLVEFALALPGTHKLRDGRKKAVLTDAFPDLLPPHVAARPKTGFHVPALQWTPRTCRDLWQAAFVSETAQVLLLPGFRRRAIGAYTTARSARQDEWAAFVLLEVIRRQGLSL